MSNIEPLAREWMKHKHAETNAQKKRLETEVKLVEAIGAKPEGAETHDIGKYKVTLTGKMTRSLVMPEWEKVKSKIDMNLWPVKTVTSADATGCKYLANNDPEIWAMVSSAFITKPAKTAVAVKEA